MEGKEGFRPRWMGHLHLIKKKDLHKLYVFDKQPHTITKEMQPWWKVRGVNSFTAQKKMMIFFLMTYGIVWKECSCLTSWWFCLFLQQIIVLLSSTTSFVLFVLSKLMLKATKTETQTALFYRYSELQCNSREHCRSTAYIKWPQITHHQSSFYHLQVFPQVQCCCTLIFLDVEVLTTCSGFNRREDILLSYNPLQSSGLPEATISSPERGEVSWIA